MTSFQINFLDAVPTIVIIIIIIIVVVIVTVIVAAVVSFCGLKSV